MAITITFGPAPDYLTKEPYDANPEHNLREYSVVAFNDRWFIVHIGPVTQIGYHSSQWVDIVAPKLTIVAGPFSAEWQAAEAADKLEQ